jgi:hypothetical protein
MIKEMRFLVEVKHLAFSGLVTGSTLGQAATVPIRYSESHVQFLLKTS